MNQIKSNLVDGLMDGPDTLNAMQKTSALCEVTLQKKSRKTPKKSFKMRTKKNWLFWRLFMISSEMVLRKELRFVTLRSVYQETPIEPSKSTIGKIQIFHHKGVPFLFKGVPIFSSDLDHPTDETRLVL